MIKGLQRTSTVGMSRAEWLKLRKQGIGGSDAAGIVGLSRYSTPYTVWADKTGRLPEKEDTEAMRQGRDFEDYVARRWMEETGKKVRRLNAILQNPDYPFALANVDRMVDGEDAGLECKTTSVLNVRNFRGVEFPEKYYVQCVHYLAVTGAQRWYLAVLVLGDSFHVYALERDQAEIDALVNAEAAFWEYVKKDTPPPVDGGKPTDEALTVIYSESENTSIDLFGREGMLSEYFDLKAQRTAIDNRIDEIANFIKADMGKNAYGECSDFSVSWKSKTRRTFDVKAFEADNGNLDLSPYYRITQSRPFKVKDLREKKEDFS